MVLSAVTGDAIDEEELGTWAGIPLVNSALHALRDGAISRNVFGFWIQRERKHFSDFQCSNVIGFVTIGSCGLLFDSPRRHDSSLQDFAFGIKNTKKVKKFPKFVKFTSCTGFPL